MGAGEEDLRPAQLVADVVEVGADAILGAEQLARDQVVAAHDRLGPAEIDQHVAVLDALDLADHDLADPVLVLVVLPLALGLAHPLDDHLLGALRRDPAEVDRRQRVQDVIADLGRGIAHLRVLEPDLAIVVLDRVRHLELAIEPVLAGARGRSRPRSRARRHSSGAPPSGRPAPWPPAPRRSRCLFPAPPPRRRAALPRGPGSSSCPSCDVPCLQPRPCSAAAALEQGRRQRQLGLLDRGEREPDRARHSPPRPRSRPAPNHAHTAKPLAALDGRLAFELGLEAGEPNEVLAATSGRSMPGELTSSA